MRVTQGYIGLRAPQNGGGVGTFQWVPLVRTIMCWDLYLGFPFMETTTTLKLYKVTQAWCYPPTCGYEVA